MEFRESADRCSSSRKGVCEGLIRERPRWQDGQRPFREYPGTEYEHFALPQDYQQPGEWTFARLMYPPFVATQQIPYYRYSFRRRYGNWKNSGPRTSSPAAGRGEVRRSSPGSGISWLN